jgi:hypothetical protein
MTSVLLPLKTPISLKMTIKTMRMTTPKNIARQSFFFLNTKCGNIEHISEGFVHLRHDRAL